MKYTLSTIILIAILGIIACGPKKTEETDENLADTTWVHDEEANRWENPTETFTGTANGVHIKFQHRDYTSYRLITGVDTAEGLLNTERGYQDDPDATLYILYYEMPDSVLWHFVRMTDGKVIMLDKDRNVLPDTEFKKE